MEKAIELLQYIVENIVEDVESIKIESKVDDMGNLLLLSVAKDDMWKVIGKGGKTIQAIRDLLKVVGSKLEERIYLKVVEDEV